MQKIPTLFERDWNGDRSRVLSTVHPGCEWVLAGEGVATRKFDGQCCMIRDGKLYKRREIKTDQTAPADFEEIGHDPETGKRVGWVPVKISSPDDQWFVQAFENDAQKHDGTYELCGPKSQGGVENAYVESVVGPKMHLLVAHGKFIYGEVPRDFEGLKAWLATQDVEGVVFHHPDGRMAKIKKRDFGFKRTT